ncbi:tyrosine-type recombinase/integrase [Streptomyces sp. URMC 129]|uniref:tyrosine-type recombinase/integrase n=1 Tax=Streptomyces sp. URMC 129 TaxID=3423407 RepID=UPI003F1D6ADF
MDPVKRGDGRYAARVYTIQSDGTRKPKWVYSRDLAECIRKRDELLAKTRDQIPVPTKSALLNEWLDYWLEEIVRKDYAYTTYARYESDCRLHIRPALGGQRLQALTVPMVRSLKSALRRKSDSVAKNSLVALRSALKAAMKEELLTRNVADLVDLPDIEPTERIPWREKEIIAFFQGVRDHHLYPAFVLALVLGLRRGEVRALRWKRIDWDRQAIRVDHQAQRVTVPGMEAVEEERRAKGKGRRKNQGYIAMPDALIPILLAHQERQQAAFLAAGRVWTEEECVFQGRAGMLGRDTLYKSFVRTSRRLGLRVVRLHDARHAASTCLADTGAKPHVAQGILGHAHADTTLTVYTHAELEAQREALNRAANLMLQ